MTYRARAAGRSSKKRDKFLLRAAPLVEEAARVNYSNGRARGTCDATDALTRTFSQPGENTVILNEEPKYRVLKVPYPLATDRQFALARISTTMHVRFETFRYVPMACSLDGKAYIKWWNIEADMEDGRRRTIRPMQAALAHLDDAIKQFEYGYGRPDEKRFMDSLRRSRGFLLEEVADPKLAVDVMASAWP